jgi:hypothetical protein
MGRRRKATGFSYTDIVSSAYVGPSEYEHAQRAWSETVEKPKGNHSGRKGKNVEPILPLADDMDDPFDDLS